MLHHSYVYYDNVFTVPLIVFPIVLMFSLFPLILLIYYFHNTRSRIGTFLVSKVFLSPSVVSVTILVAQILFGFRAVKQKRRDPSIIVINGRHYKLNGLTLGSIAYYNFITICTIIFVSLQFMIRNTAWSVEECKSGADCFYLNYSAIPPDNPQEDPPVIPIENCTLENDYDENDVTCYSIGFHPVVGIALLGGFINIVTPLMFAFYVGLPVKLFGKKIKKMYDDRMKGKSNNESGFLIIILFYSLLVVSLTVGSSLAVVLLVSVNYGIPKDHQSSFEKMFLSESFFGQSLAFCIINSAFCMYPVMFIEQYPATQDDVSNEDEDDDSINQNETVNSARGASGRGARGGLRGGGSRLNQSYGATAATQC